MSLRLARFLLVAAHGALPLLLVSVLAQAVEPSPPTGDRSEIEAKKKAREEAEKRKAEATASAVKETSEQRETRERLEKKEQNAKEARKRAQSALEAAGRRQNQKGMELMAAAWKLDPYTLDYPLNTGEFAKALNDNELEFAARAAVKVLATRQLTQVPESSPRRKEIEEALKIANERIEFLKTRLSVGLLNVQVEPKNCDILLEGAYVGQGSGQIEAITGQKKAETRCVGFADFEQFVNVRVGDPTHVTLKPKQIAYFGKLIVKVEPADGVTVYLDDVPVADRKADKPTPDGKVGGVGTRQDPFQLAARKWVVRLQKDGYDRWHRRIDIKRDDTTMIDARLEALNETVESSDKAPLKPAEPPKPAGK